MAPENRDPEALRNAPGAELSELRVYPYKAVNLK